jgi:hypothetical protein
MSGFPTRTRWLIVALVFCMGLLTPNPQPQAVFCLLLPPSPGNLQAG